MTLAPIVLLVSMKPKKGEEDTLKELLMQTAEESRAEDGCEIYQLLESNDPEPEILLVEKWRDKHAFKAHQNAPHLTRALAAMGNLLVAPPTFVPWRSID